MNRKTNPHIPKTKRGEKRKPGPKVMSPALREAVRLEGIHMRRLSHQVPGLVRTIEEIESERLTKALGLPLYPHAGEINES